MSLKQFGGVFGRNPTFNDVTVEGDLILNGDTFTGLDYQGTWDASTNTPTLVSSTGTNGEFYIVSVAGATDLNGITNWGIGDWVMFNGSTWQRVEGGAEGNFTNLTVSGDAKFSAGLAASPSISHEGDSDTGIYWPSGANNLAFVTGGVNRVRVTSDGDVGIGTTSPTAKLEVDGSFKANGNTTLGDASTDTVTVNGYMGVGGAANSSIGVYANPTALVGPAQTGVYSFPVGTSGATTAVRAFLSLPSTAASAYASADVAGYWAGNAIKGAGSTITNQHGLYVADQTQGTNNFGITSLVSSGSNKWNIYASGTAANYFAGKTFVSTTTDQDGRLVVRSTGNSYANSGVAIVDSANTTKLQMLQTTSGFFYMTVNGADDFVLKPTEVVFNEGGNDYDFRVESDTNTHALFVQGSDGSVGIGTSSPIYDLQLGSYGVDADSTLALASTTTGTCSIRFGDGTSGAAANAGRIQYDHSVDAMTFSTNAGTERLRIKSAGQTRFVPLASDPAGAEAGDVYYNSGTNKLKLYDGTSWVDLN